MQEEVWQSAEVDALYRLAAAGVRVPQPHLCYEGVLLMDLIVDADGDPAPRLNDVELNEELALEFHALLIKQVVRMLCAGIIHGDLSEYNILVGEGRAGDHRCAAGDRRGGQQQCGRDVCAGT
jgi:RIO kinase 1